MLHLWSGMIVRAAVTWGIVAVLLAILGAALESRLPQVDGLTLASYAFLLAGVHYSAKARSDFLQAAVGGGLAGLLVAVLLVLLRYISILGLAPPPGTPFDLLTALLQGFIAGVAGGLSYKFIER